jgi:uncharacterized protein YggE
MERPSYDQAKLDRPANGHAQPPVVSVRGEATMVVDPEVADLRIAVTSQARDRREAFERLVRRNDEVLNLLRSYGDSVDHIESTGVAVAPEVRRGRDEKIRSYYGAVRVNASVADFAVLGELVARVADLEAASLDGPYWRLRRSSPVYREARSRAVGEALQRARDYAEALGCRVTGLIEVADTGMSGTSVPPRMRGGDMMMSAPLMRAATAAEPAALDLEPQQQTVQASVEARFYTSQPDFS